MGMPFHCTVSACRRLREAGLLALLSTGVLLVHGFHPWAEDGGLYVSGVLALLRPELFPHDHAFVAAPMRFSVFAPVVAALVRALHTSLAGVLLGLYLLTTALMLFAALRIMRACFADCVAAQWSAVCLLGAWWTMPVAGTSLWLMDPYLTARSFATPLLVLAISYALPPGQVPPRVPLERLKARRQTEAPGWLRPVVPCFALLAVAAAFHPLMTLYGAVFILSIALQRRRSSMRTYTFLGSALGLLAVSLQVLAAPDQPAAAAAVSSRYYWFLAQWQWYEWLGLAAPLACFAVLGRWFHSGRGGSRLGLAPLALLGRSAIVGGCFAVLVSLVFAQERFQVHAIARMQPLRFFVFVYALLPLALGGALARALSQTVKERIRVARPRAPGRRPRANLPRLVVVPTVVALSATIFFWVQRDTFSASPHIEWPGTASRNPWTQAFVWARDHTDPAALFALDARYVNLHGEDAQGFRALAQRSMVPDFSKDGGEAANFPQLAPAWQEGATRTAGLSQLPKQQRRLRLRGFGVRWVVLQAASPAAAPCPYRNAVVEVCAL